MMSSFTFLINVNIHHYTMTTLGLCYPSFSKKHHNFLKSFGTNPTTWHPSSSICLLQGAKYFFLTLFFSDLIPETWEQSLLKLCCWLVTACFRSFCHTVLNIRSSVTHSSFLATNRAFTRVKSDTYSESHLAKDLRTHQMSIILC